MARFMLRTAQPNSPAKISALTTENNPDLAVQRANLNAKYRPRQLTCSMLCRAVLVSTLASALSGLHIIRQWTLALIRTVRGGLFITEYLTGDLLA